MKRNNAFRVIGITGGVGAGKSVVLNYLKEKYPCEILVADDIGNEVKMPGGRCYEAFIETRPMYILSTRDSPHT